jgi:16S rRNA (guanine(527)-N(7))-methyltransferase RsmG
MITKKIEFQELPEWHAFIQEYALNDTQALQFAQYANMIRSYNELFNLTAITDPKAIIDSHFRDSLAISKYVNFKDINSIADVGSGAGFPGIPLKILFPELGVILIEVTHKKIEFLNTVIAQLQLKKCSVYPLDWRTFLRQADESVDLFVSRASLHTDELMRVFKPGCAYKSSQLVYWASKDWMISAVEQPYFEKEVSYTIKNKKRRFIFFVTHYNA